MTTISIALSVERLARLRTLAEQAGISPEEYLSRHVERLCDASETRFKDVAEHVLRKNAELYRRLA